MVFFLLWLPSDNYDHTYLKEYRIQLIQVYIIIIYIKYKYNNHKHMPPRRQLNHRTDAKKRFKFIDARLLYLPLKCT